MRLSGRQYKTEITGKRRLKKPAFLLAVAVLMLLTTGAGAEIIPGYGMGQIGYQAVVLCESLTIREERSTSSKACGTLNYGDTFACQQAWDGWCDCFLSDAEGTGSAGWVLSDYVVINPDWYVTEKSTPVYAWNDQSANKLALLDKGEWLPIIRQDGDWALVSLRGAAGWIHKTEKDRALNNPFHRMQTLVCAELSAPGGIFVCKDEEALQWILHNFAIAEYQLGSYACPLDAELTVTDIAGNSVHVQVATDSCHSFVTENGEWYAYGDGEQALRETGSTSGISEAFYRLFGLTANQLYR